MRHLRKYNESENNDRLVEYVEECFIEFMDDDNFEINWNVNEDQCNIVIRSYNSKEMEKNNSRLLSLFEIKNISDRKSDYLKRIEIAFGKIKVEFPHLQYKIEDYDIEKLKIDLALDTSISVIRYPRYWKNI